MGCGLPFLSPAGRFGQHFLGGSAAPAWVEVPSLAGEFGRRKSACFRGCLGQPVSAVGGFPSSSFFSWIHPLAQRGREARADHFQGPEMSPFAGVPSRSFFWGGGISGCRPSNGPVALPRMGWGRTGLPEHFCSAWCSVSCHFPWSIAKLNSFPL